MGQLKKRHSQKQSKSMASKVTNQTHGTFN
jgi:hypothetical protein